MGEFKHKLSMLNPKSGNRDSYFFNHSIADEIQCILEFWSPAGFYDFCIDDKAVDLNDIKKSER